MPQLEKGGKWIFGWVIVSSFKTVLIPDEAFSEYGFQEGCVVSFLHSSRRSGGFSIGLPEKLNQSKISLQSRVFSQDIILPGKQIKVPQNMTINPENRFLVVRGSGLALLFLLQGPIYELAKNHVEVMTFDL
jgi:hypothetical protein